MALTQDEIKSVTEKAKAIVELNVMEFLKMIEEKAKAWKKDLTNG